MTVRRRALALAEVLVCVAIIGALMMAVAAALVAGSGAVDANDRHIKSAQAARVSLAVMLRDVRQSDACQVGTTVQQAASTVTSTELQTLTPEGEILRYVYDPDSFVLSVQVDDESPRVLARNVSSCTFKSAVETIGASRETVHVSIALVVGGKQPVRLSGSTSPRRLMP